MLGDVLCLFTLVLPSVPYKEGVHATGKHSFFFSFFFREGGGGVPLMEFLYAIFTRISSECYRGRFMSLLCTISVERYYFPLLIHVSVVVHLVCRAILFLFVC